MTEKHPKTPKDPDQFAKSTSTLRRGRALPTPRQKVSGIVAMPKQWELANFELEYQFVVRQYAVGEGAFGQRPLAR